MLREESGAGDEFVLADYFDYIAGTSTGAIIATCLSVGMSVDEIRDFYVENATEMFDKASLLRRASATSTRTIASPRGCGEELGEETTLGSEQLRTLLLIVMRNATTDSPWPLSNNPAREVQPARAASSGTSTSRSGSSSARAPRRRRSSRPR